MPRAEESFTNGMRQILPLPSISQKRHPSFPDRPIGDGRAQPKRIQKPTSLCIFVAAAFQQIVSADPSILRRLLMFANRRPHSVKSSSKVLTLLLLEV
jgi:hypothetical protein